MLERRLVIGALILLAAFVRVATTEAAEKYKGYVRREIFIPAQELNRLIQAKDQKPVIAVASKTEYYAGHIPGSFHLWRPGRRNNPPAAGR